MVRPTVLVWLRKHDPLDWSKEKDKPKTLGNGMSD